MLKKFVLLFPLFLTACDDAKLAVINTNIESPVRNTCQSADLDKDVPKCEWYSSPRLGALHTE